jgi:hypothetical protein
MGELNWMIGLIDMVLRETAPEGKCWFELAQDKSTTVNTAMLKNRNYLFN